MLITFSWSCHRSSSDISSQGFFNRVAAEQQPAAVAGVRLTQQAPSRGFAVYGCLSELRLTATGNGCVCTVSGASAVVGAGSTSVLRFLPLRLAEAGSSSAVASATASSVVVLFFGGLPRLAWQAVAHLLPSCCAGSSGLPLQGLLLLHQPAARLPVRDSNIWNQSSSRLLWCCGYRLLFRCCSSVAAAVLLLFYCCCCCCCRCVADVIAADTKHKQYFARRSMGWIMYRFWSQK